ncbi:MAG: hypothetical protein VKL39_07160 [Leptolyngbyaceae bacterium]|nr:hypothetical protein [Leptolyngbyaceae bacterium]
MSDPLIRAFFVGRAIAEAVNEQLEAAVTGALSEFGKFDAEQRERLRNFSSDVAERANREEQRFAQNTSTSSTDADSSFVTSEDDIQALIDDLRAEIAQLRTELQRYRNRST